MSMAEVTAGAEIDAWCTRCKLLLNHVIVAAVAGKPRRVRCLTCSTDHAYRVAAPGTPRPAGAPRTRAGARKAASAIEAASDLSLPAHDYLMSGSYREGDLIMHPVHGRGRVQAQRGTKIDVQFLSGLRTLIHGQPR